MPQIIYYVKCMRLPILCVVRYITITTRIYSITLFMEKIDQEPRTIGLGPLTPVTPTDEDISQYIPM
jgi:hypothetical protein